MLSLMRSVATLALLPFIFLTLRAIFWGSAGFFVGLNPTNAQPPILATCTTMQKDRGHDMMAVSSPLTDMARSLLAEKGLDLVSCDTLQSLWAGYGHVCAIKATQSRAGTSQSAESAPVSLILKYISPPPMASLSDEGHLRKILSYQVEQYFYTYLATQLPESVAVAECVGSINDGKTTALMLKDLKSSNKLFKPEAVFPVSLQKRGELNLAQTNAALNWLAGFHGYFWGNTAKIRQSQLLRPPLEEAKEQAARKLDKDTNGLGIQFNVQGIWLNGGYTYLATRRKEYATLAEDTEVEWSHILCKPSSDDPLSLAERVAVFLTPSNESSSAGPLSEYETVIHGDVKSENMFASASGDQVAFVDFQYVGLGLGVCDLAKLFTCSVPIALLVDDAESVWLKGALSMQSGERELLHYYLRELELVSGKKYPWDVFIRHWEVALVDWLRFQASWGFWGNTEWLEARVNYIVKYSKIHDYI